MVRSRQTKTALVYDYLRQRHQMARAEGLETLTLTPDEVAEGAGLFTTGDDYILVCQALLTREELTAQTRLRLQPLRFRVL